ncbi:DUF2946 family protein [Roseateles paludis]|uniref:DUF2946 family protein n=1 Tax=Roseateles paludis TaxID=3145238 RepID=A0ABV0FZG2_9BURK
MKLTARLLLLVLLAVLLPLRSSFALGLPGSDVPCHLAGAMQQMADDGDHAKPCHQAAGHAATHCDHCSACTLATPLFGPPPALLVPTEAAPLRYPPLLAPAPCHRAEGLERPPRNA